jgi:plastocyanin
MKPRSLRQAHNTARLLAVVVTVVIVALWTSTTVSADSTGDAYTAAAALGVVRNEGSDASSVVVSIDFDVPRYGPLCISVDEGDVLEFVWEEYHNLHMLLDEASFVDCDFSNAVALSPEGKPQPMGYTVVAEAVTAQEDVSYFSCSKICASNGHKVQVCRGGSLGQTNECFATAECSSERTIDVRTMIAEGPRDYLPVGKVCRPKNGDGYVIASDIDTPESCRKKCDDYASRCGAWEFEDYDADNKECELHEIDVVSYEETLAMGDCLTATTTTTSDEDYRCCWIAREVVEAQTGTATENTPSSGSRAPMGGPRIVVFSIATILLLVALLFSGM